MAKSTTDKKTLELINEVKKRKAEIAKAERPNWKTHCSFSYQEGSSQTINLHVEKDVGKLINIVAFLRGRESSYEAAKKELGVDAPDFTWMGFKISEWWEDVKMRIDKIQIADKKKKLELMESRLDKIISPELKAQMELEAIEAELS